MRTSDGFWPVAITLGNVPELARFMRTWPLTLLMPRSTDKVGFGAVMGFANSFIDRRLAPGATPQKDMIQAFIKAGMTRGELVQEVYAEIFAGVDTVATALRMTLLSLLAQPAAFAALRREIDDAVAAGKVSSPATQAECQEMPYLLACVREGLRMYPPGTGLLYKQVPPGGDVVHGHRLPEGTQVGQNICGVTHDKDVFGPDADVFRPDRWIEADEDRFRFMASVADLVFGHGKFMCVGKGIALMELNKVFVEVGPPAFGFMHIADEPRCSCSDDTTSQPSNQRAP
jgi:cytochrome P450